MKATLLKVALVIGVFNIFKINPTVGIYIFGVFVCFVIVTMLKQLTNKYRLYSILTAVILTSYMYFLYNSTTLELLAEIIRNMFIGVTIFFCKQNSYFSKKLAVISIFPSFLLTLGGLYIYLLATPLPQEVINKFPEMANLADLYLKVIENNNLLLFLQESEILLEMIVSIIFSVLGNVIILSGVYYCVHHFLLKNRL